MSQADEHNEMRPTAFTWFVWGVGCFVLLAVVAAILLPALARSNGGRRSSCMNNLKQIGLSLLMYANESQGGLYPTISREPGRLMFEPLQMYPEYMPDPSVDICPIDSDFENLAQVPNEQNSWKSLKDNVEPTAVIDDWSYFYLGYAVRDDYDMERFAEFYRAHLRSSIPMEADIYAERTSVDPEGLRVVFRLREGVEALILESTLQNQDPESLGRVASEIPLLIERLGNHMPEGANVVYLDGHVEFIRYPGKWPMTEKTVRILNELDALGN